MANQATQNSLIESTFITAWDDETAYYFRNQFPPATMPAEYINVLTFDGVGNKVFLNQGKRRKACSVVGEIRVPKGQGPGRADTLAQMFLDIYQDQFIGSMRFRQASISEVNGQSHYGVNVFIPYQWDEDDNA